MLDEHVQLADICSVLSELIHALSHHMRLLSLVTVKKSAAAALLKPSPAKPHVLHNSFTAPLYLNSLESEGSWCNIKDHTLNTFQSTPDHSLIKRYTIFPRVSQLRSTSLTWRVLRRNKDVLSWETDFTTTLWWMRLKELLKSHCALSARIQCRNKS